MRKIVFFVALVCLGLLSCVKEPVDPVSPGNPETPGAEGDLTNPVTLTFSADADTKVHIEGETAGDQTAVWDENDRIKIVWYNTDEGKAKSATATVNSFGTASTTFTATVEEADHYYAVYPSTLTTTLDGEGNFKVSFADGKAASTQFKDAAWYAAKTSAEAKSFAFRAISTLIKFQIRDTGAEGIYFRSIAKLTKLYGKSAISFTDSGDDGVFETATVGLPDGNAYMNATVSGAGTYYLTLPATLQTAAKDETNHYDPGFIIQIKKGEEHIPAAYWSAAIQLNPGKLYSLTTAVDDKIIWDYYVSNEGEGTGLTAESYSSLTRLTDWTDGQPAFRTNTKASALMRDGITVHLKGGETFTSPIALSFEATMERTVNFVGGQGGGATTFTTSSPSTFSNEKLTANLSGITFSGCAAGALKVTTGKVNVSGCTFSSNTATNGGAVAIRGSSSSTDDNLQVAFTNCIFSENAASATDATGGGAVLVSSATAGVLIGFDNCRFALNTAPQGAALYTTSSAAVFFNQCTFYQNKATKTDSNQINGYTIYCGGGNGRLGLNNCTLQAIARSAGNYNAASNGTELCSMGYGVISNSTIWCSGNTGNRALIWAGRKTETVGSVADDNVVVNCILHEKSTSYNALFIHANYKVKVLHCVYDGQTTSADGNNQIIEASLNRGDKNGLSVTATNKTNQLVNGVGHSYYTLTKSSFCDAFVPASRAYVKKAIKNTNGIGELFYNWLESIGALDVDIMGRSRGAVMTPGSYDMGWTEADYPSASELAPAAQYKYALTADEDLDGKVTAGVAGLKVLLTDSKYYAAGERVLSVSFAASSGGHVASGDSDTVTMTWESDDEVNYPAVAHSPSAGEYGLRCLPGSYSGIFTVVTSRHTYEFTKSFTATSAATTTVTLDFAAPDSQPTRKVGIFGDSISTFSGELYDATYRAFYPDMDPNYNNTDPTLAAKAVDTKEKTWWGRIIWGKMTYGDVDVVNSWGGTKLVHHNYIGSDDVTKYWAGFIDRVYNFNDPDIIFIHGGTNDTNGSTPLGEYTWDTPQGQGDKTKFRNCYIELIKSLQSRFQDVKIIIIVGDRLGSSYAESAITVAQHFGLPYVSFQGESASIEKCSGSHPTSAGFEYMANKIYTQLEDYLP